MTTNNLAALGPQAVMAMHELASMLQVLGPLYLRMSLQGTTPQVRICRDRQDGTEEVLFSGTLEPLRAPPTPTPERPATRSAPQWESPARKLIGEWMRSHGYTPREATNWSNMLDDLVEQVKATARANRGIRPSDGAAMTPELAASLREIVR